MFAIGEKVIVQNRQWAHAEATVVLHDPGKDRYKLKIQTGRGGRTIAWIKAPDVHRLNGEIIQALVADRSLA